MSTYLEIIPETSYHKLLSQINYDRMPFEEIDELFDEAVAHDTSFTGDRSRLLDIIHESEPFYDKFTKEFDYNVYRIRKSKLIKTIHESENEELREKWAFALNNLQFVDDNEYLYFFMD